MKELRELLYIVGALASIAGLLLMLASGLHTKRATERRTAHREPETRLQIIPEGSSKK